MQNPRTAVVRALSAYRPTVVCALAPEGAGRCRRCDGTLKLNAEARGVLADGGYTVCKPCMNAIIQGHPAAVQFHSPA